MATFQTSSGFLYQHTGITPLNRPLFDTESQRDTFFTRFNRLSFHDYSYTRPSNIVSLHNTKQYYEKMPNGYAPGSITMNAPIENLNGYDYLMFINSHSNLPYYGFIEYVEYINESTTRVWFSIDWFATYQFQIDIVSGYVEREHMKDSEEWNALHQPNYKANLYQPDFESNGTFTYKLESSDFDDIQGGDISYTDLY